MDFYWHDCPDPQRHIEAAVDALWAAMQGPARRWNPWTERMVKAEFRDRLNVAAAGCLKPVDEVREIGEGRVLFEIRWLEIPVTDVDEGGTVRHSTTQARLLHAEPVELSVCAVGLHAHEKTVFPDAGLTRAAQEAEIAVALTRYHQGIGHLWGITRP